MLAIYKSYNNATEYAKDETPLFSGVATSYDELYNRTFSPFAKWIFLNPPQGETYQAKKQYLRNKAISVQAFTNNTPLSWGEIATITNYFTTYAKQYGLTTEFTENGII